MQGIDTLQLYRAEVAQHPRLSASQTRALVESISHAQAEQDRAEVARYKEVLICGHLALVADVAFEWRNTFLRHLKMTDLIQGGNVGLLRAVASYDDAHPCGSFTRYARVSIRHGIADGFFADDTIMLNVKATRRQHKRGALDPLRERLRGMHPLSLDRVFTDESGESVPLSELAVSASTAQAPLGQHGQVERLLALLTPREKQIIRLLSGLDEQAACTPTSSGVEQYLGVSCVTSLRNRAFRKLRQAVARLC